MDIAFRKYRKEDQPAVLDMMASFNALYGYAFDAAVRESNLRAFSSQEASGRLYLILSDKQPIGYLVLAFGFSFEYQGRDAFLDEFFIKEAYRNQGIGKRALQFLEAEARQLHVNAIHLEVELQNQQAHHLYASLGYEAHNRKLLTKILPPEQKGAASTPPERQ